MSRHTYIGARYTPRFMGTYDPTQQYEALDVVDNGSGTSYIARDIVPPGTPLSDNTHWFLYGASSGAIVQLQNDVLQLQNDDLQLQSDVGRLQNRKYLIFGDSYDVVASVGASWSSIVIGRLGITAQVLSKAYAGFIGDGAHDTWSDLLTNATITDPNEITDVIILGGANDHNESKASLYTAMDSFKAQVLAACPNVKRFHIGFVGYCIGRAYANTLSYITARHYYYENANELGWAVIPNICYVLFDPRIFRESTDSNHPSVAGVGKIADALEQYLLTGSCDVGYSYTGTINLDSSNFTDTSHNPTTSNFVAWMKNGVLYLRLAQKSARWVNGVIRTDGTQYVYGRIADNENPIPPSSRISVFPVGYIENGVGFRDFIGLGWNQNRELVVNASKAPLAYDMTVDQLMTFMLDVSELCISLD